MERFPSIIGKLLAMTERFPIIIAKLSAMMERFPHYYSYVIGHDGGSPIIIAKLLVMMEVPALL